MVVFHSNSVDMCMLAVCMCKVNGFTVHEAVTEEYICCVVKRYSILIFDYLFVIVLAYFPPIYMFLNHIIFLLYFTILS